MKTTCALACFILTASMGYAMEVKQFDGVMSNIRVKKLDLVESFLSANEKVLDNDPDYYVLLLNFMMVKGSQTGTGADEGEPQKDDAAARDPKTGGGYDEKLIADGIAKTSKALPFFRSRLDIRIGIMAAAGEIKRWDLLSDQLVETLRVSKEIENKWTWGPINSMSGDPRDFMLENVQGYLSILFRANDPKADDTIIRASEAMIKYCPETVYGYANLGVIYLTRKEYDKADAYLKKARAIDPNDETLKENMLFLEEETKKEGTKIK